MDRKLGFPTTNARGTHIALLLAAVALVLIPYALLGIVVPIGRDSGVFMYGGSTINSGGAPYLDAWDHKGPLLYIFNAAGLRLFDGPRGVILLEGFLLFVALLFSMYCWKRFLSLGWVLIASAAFSLAYYGAFEGGNLTETWCIPFLLSSYSLAFVYLSEQDDLRRRRCAILLPMAIGTSFAVAALTRPNNGVGLVFLAFSLFVFKIKGRFRFSAIIVMAGAAIVLPVVLWLYKADAMDAFIDQYLVFNASYVQGASMFARAKTFYHLFEATILSPLGVVMLLVSGFIVFAERRPSANEPASFFNRLMMSVFVVESLAQALSGQSLLHYAALALPALALLLVGLLVRIDQEGQRFLAIRKNRVLAFVLLALFCMAAMRPAYAIRDLLQGGTQVTGATQNTLTGYLREHTSAADSVVIHGAETWLLVTAGRRSPSNITYYYPAVAHFKDSYKKYISDIVQGAPRYIIESPTSCGLSKEPCSPDPTLFVELKDYLLAEYQLEATLRGYKFWRRKA